MVNIQDELDELYEKWLMQEYPEEIKNKDDLIEKTCDGYMHDEFATIIKKSL